MMSAKTTAGEIYSYIDGFAPFSSAMDYDNVGLLVGSPDDSADRVLLSLDITPAVVEEAVCRDAQLIVSHHPVIFTPLRQLEKAGVPYLLARAGIAAICAHTNLDLAPDGVNNSFADILQVSGIKPLSLYNGLAESVIGTLKNKMPPAAFAEHVKNRLACEGVRYTVGNRPVQRVALCCGAGGDCIFNAVNQGADAFVTGEIKHHEMLAGVQAGLTVVAAGHFKTENGMMPVLQKKLQQQFVHTEFILAQSGTDAVHFL